MKHKVIPVIGIILLVISVLTYMASPVLAAVGCTLTNPDRDIRTLFPSSTGYKTHFNFTFTEKA